MFAPCEFVAGGNGPDPTIRGLATVRFNSGFIMLLYFSVLLSSIVSIFAVGLISSFELY